MTRSFVCKMLFISIGCLFLFGVGRAAKAQSLSIKAYPTTIEIGAYTSITLTLSEISAQYGADVQCYADYDTIFVGSWNSSSSSAMTINWYPRESNDYPVYCVVTGITFPLTSNTIWVEVNPPN